MSKPEPFIENSRDYEILNLNENPEVFLQNDRDLSFQSIVSDSPSKLTVLREKLMDSEDFLQMYKEDLNRLQENYLKVLAEKDRLILKVDALMLSNQDLQRALSDCQNYINDLSTENSDQQKIIKDLRIQYENIASEKGKIQKTLEMLEKEDYKNKIYIETIENGNVLLLASNQKLKFEMEKAKANEESLLFSLQLLKKTVKSPLIQPVPNTMQEIELDDLSLMSVSDSEHEKMLNFDEETEKKQNFSCSLQEKLTKQADFQENIIKSMKVIKSNEVKPLVSLNNNCDNYILYTSFLKGTEGVIYEDLKLQIGVKFEIENQNC